MFGDAGDDTIRGEASGATLSGGAGDDLIEISFSTNEIFGGEGNDTILAQGTVDGGAGDDVITTGSNSDVLIGAEGNDTVVVAGSLTAQTSGFETMLVGAGVFLSGQNLAGVVRLGTIAADGRDVFLLGRGGVFDFSGVEILDDAGLEFRVSGISTTILGGAGDDTLTGDTGADRIVGNDGADVIAGQLGDDTLLGGDGDDRVSDQGDDADLIDGGAGNDTLQGGRGVDVLMGGDGDDLVRIDFDDLAPGERLDGGAGNDTLVFTNSFQSLAGVSTSGFETLLIADRIRIDADDLIGVTRIGNSFGEGRPLEVAGVSTGTYDLSNIGVPAGTPLLFRGSAGDDSVTGSGAGESVFGGQGRDTVRGGDGADTIGGEDGADLIAGGGGDDLLFGGLDDSLDGGAGDDLITYGPFGGATATRIVGGDGIDTLSLAAVTRLIGVAVEGVEALLVSGFASVTAAQLAGFQILGSVSGEGQTIRVNALSGGLYDFSALSLIRGTLVGFDGSIDADTALGTDLSDSLFGGDGADRLIGGAGNDTLSGGNGDDRAAGEADHDSIRGGVGADALRGGDGSDTLDGGDGADTLRGGAGDDTLTGGADSDVFDFARANRGGDDRVQDFADGVDRLRFTGFGSAADILAAAAEVLVDGQIGTLIQLHASAGGAVGSVLLQNLALARLDVEDLIVG